MKKWYVAADAVRTATEGERAQIGVAGARIYAGRVKTIVNADTPQEAIEKGRAIIKAALEDGVQAANFGCMDVESAKAMGDEETYARMRTV